MKSFDWTWTNYTNNIPMPPPPYRRIGVSYQKYAIPTKLGTRHVITFWMYKWFRVIQYDSLSQEKK